LCLLCFSAAAQDVIRGTVVDQNGEAIIGAGSDAGPFAFIKGKAYLCIRKMKKTGLFKPYAIIDQNTFDAEIKNLKKQKPLN
jgi:hypothetical protein